MIEQGRVGGIYLTKENLGDTNGNPGMKASMLQAYWVQCPKYNGKPMIIMAEQEGGKTRVFKQKGPVKSAQETGKELELISAGFNAGNEAANALYNISVNTNVAPVADLARHPDNFIAADQRSYGKEAQNVAKIIPQFTKAAKKLGILSIVKHYPGLGAAGSQSTDDAPVTIKNNLEDLEAKDLVPFQAAAKANVDMIMVSWATYPALDTKYPAGLSKKWIKKLRDDLGYKGVTVTDSIEAGALHPFSDDPAELGVMASKAGMDFILASSRNETQGEQIVEGLFRALKNGTLDRNEFHEGTKRLRKLRDYVFRD
ncbi:hypothetical protein KEM55_004727 [Ascosphaera atra]|nr:hypothetical protein KEM55_004727 [Ascosphaera atra]